MKIVLIDDHSLFLESVAGMLRKYEFVESVLSFKSVKDFYFASVENKTDIIICDIMMPHFNGIDFLSKIKKEYPAIKVILLSSIIEVQTIRHALRIGASGYLSKDSTIEELTHALLTVYSGDQFVSESLQKALVRTTLLEDQFVYKLSSREKQVLNMVCSGKTIKEVAYELELSVHTVQTYYKNIMKKFNVNRTADLIVFAIHNGLYTPQ